MTRDEFRSKAYEDTKTGCWLWHGKAKYGPSRKSYVAFKGPIPKGLWVLHKCDVPKCINPKHLFLGDRTDNMRDCASKGRNWQQKKTHCPQGHAYAGNYYLETQHGLKRRRCKVCHKAKVNRIRWAKAKRSGKQ